MFIFLAEQENQFKKNKENLSKTNVDDDLVDLVKEMRAELGKTLAENEMLVKRVQELENEK